FGEEWHFGVQLQRTSDAVDPDADYPRVVAKHGEAPPQYPDMDEWDEEWDDEDDLSEDEDELEERYGRPTSASSSHVLSRAADANWRRRIARRRRRGACRGPRRAEPGSVPCPAPAAFRIARGRRFARSRRRGSA